MYKNGEFRKAKVVFEKCLKEFNDEPSKTFIKRCDELEKLKPKNWIGAYEMKSK